MTSLEYLGDSMIEIALDFIAENEPWLLIFPPFLIWFISGAIIVGFIPAIKKTKGKKSKKWQQILFEGLKRFYSYKWEILFSAINLTFLTLFWSIFNSWLAQMLPYLPEVLILGFSFYLLLIYFLGKVTSISSRQPKKSILKSLRYLYGGFTSPFGEKFKELYSSQNNT